MRRLGRVFHWSLVASALATGLAGSANAAEAKYTLTTTLENFVAWSSNDSGQISGWSAATEHAQVYTPGQGLLTLPSPEGVVGSLGYKINASGQVGGLLDYSSSYRGPTFTSFVYSPASGQSQLLNSVSIGINSALAADGTPYLLNAGGPSWAIPGSNVTTAVSGGYAVGYSYFSTRNDNGAAWIENPDGTFNSIGQLFASRESQAYGVNDDGVTVGRVIASNGPLNAFVYVGGDAYNLFDVTDAASRVGWKSFASAQDVNNSGTIVGWGVYGNGYNQIATFVLSPIAAVPEPSASTMLFAGFAIAVAAALRSWRTPRSL